MKTKTGTDLSKLIYWEIYLLARTFGPTEWYRKPKTPIPVIRERYAKSIGVSVKSVTTHLRKEAARLAPAVLNAAC